jgi:hypothetical protein
MDGFLAGALSAVWLGVLTSISPCPLATNIAAISFIGKRITGIVFILVGVYLMLKYIFLPPIPF